MVREIMQMSIKRVHPNVRIVCSQEVIEELCRSIRAEGQLEPIEVWYSGGVFRILDGEKRWRACKKLKMTHIRAVLTQ